MKDLLKTVWNGVKKIGLATFYGLRQCLFQLFCWELFELIVNLMGFYLYGDYPGVAFVRLSAYICVVVFTMLYHWGTMIIPKEHPVIRFILPYSPCAILGLWGTDLVWLGTPFICLVFLLLENYLKRVLTSRPKAFKGIKIVYNTVPLLSLFFFILVLINIGLIGRRHMFDEDYILTRITEVYFPEFKVIEYERGKQGSRGDYRDELILEFYELPTEKFYTEIDSLARCGDYGWSVKDDSTYYYSRMWGNGLPAPRGESNEEDMFLNIEIKRGEKRFHVNYGEW